MMVMSEPVSMTPVVDTPIVLHRNMVVKTARAE